MNSRVLIKRFTRQKFVLLLPRPNLSNYPDQNLECNFPFGRCSYVSMQLSRAICNSFLNCDFNQTWVSRTVERVTSH